MKYLLTLLSVFWMNAQHTQFTYEYRSIPDSTDRANILTDVMILDVGKKQSEYFGRDAFVSDSILTEAAKKNEFPMPPNRRINRDRVIKTGNQTDYFTFVGSRRFDVQQTIRLNWKLLSEYTEILGYKAQKASTDFGGRHWIAWCISEIPIPDGPYKFQGLPGLIGRLEDSTGSHIFTLKGIKKLSGDFVYPVMPELSPVRITESQYVKAFRDGRKNPVKLSDFMDFTDSNGQFHTAQESFRESQKLVLERLAKDNNIIEIDLLKTK